MDTLGTQQVIAGKMPQKPAEWSEEDEAVLDALIRRLEGEDIYVSPHLAVERLKSLRSRPKSSDNWKPSEEQMKAMEEVRTIFHHHHLWDEINPILYDYEELIRDLYKLM